MYQTAPPTQLETPQLVRPRESDVAEDPVAPCISTSCSSSPGKCLDLVSAVSHHVPKFVRTGVFMPATSLLGLPPRGGSREEAEKLSGLHFTTACIIQVAVHIPWLSLSGPVWWEAGGSVYTARWPLCSRYSNPKGQFIVGEEVHFWGVQLSNTSIKHG